jgi:GxxExxY protein
MLGSPEEVRCSGVVVDAAVKVHEELGPGLLEHVYVSCLADELQHLGCRVRTEVPLVVRWRDRVLTPAYRLDLLVDELVVVEVKTVKQLTDVHEAQLLTYLRLSKLRVGLLLNFNSALMKQGIKRRYSFG